ncbi:MAG: hypothetical protein MK008_10985 [Bdellovibrionales bacterium]|nr:hypothetical protein [Bdellovibrionales bacterium]
MKTAVVLILISILLGVFYFKSKQFGFEYKYILKAEASEIWNEVELSLTDSLKSRIWPNKLEVLKSAKFAEGQIVDSIMYIQDKEYPVQFKITEITPGEKVSFKPLDKNFQGSDSISVRPVSDNTVELIWSGKYKVESVTLGTLFFKYYYLSKFYDEFYQNLSAHWTVEEGSKKVY